MFRFNYSHDNHENRLAWSKTSLVVKASTSGNLQGTRLCFAV